MTKMNIFISGASRGLGACLTKKFLSCGHSVFAGVSSIDNVEGLEEVKDHKELTIIQLDVTKPEEIENAKKYVEKQVDCIDVILNVAGVLLNKTGYILEDSYENLETTFKVNIIAPIYLNNVFFDLVKKSEKSVIINISSEIVAIDDVGSWFPAYCISKTSVAQYSYALKATFKQLNIDTRVFAVHPGRMKTAMGGDNGQITPEESAEHIYRIAVGEILPNNQEIYVNYMGEPMLKK
jgi:3-hydroxy acid dehydrogenase / malonic semialdehyde reductase